VRLSPESVFLLLVTLGLPFAVTAGWQLAVPADPPVAVSSPAGDDGLGAAPTQDTTSKPVTVVDWSPPATRSVPSTPATPSTTPSSAPPSATQPSAGNPPATLPPTLTVAPVPTPTDATDPSSSASASPADSTTPEPGDLEAARLVRRP
jgi:hypothetical protein